MAATAAAPRVVTLTDLVRVLSRRWPAVLVAMLLGAGAAAGYLAAAPPRYTATAEVALRLPVTNPFAYPGTGADRVLNMNVEASLATSPEVLAEVSAATGTPAPEVRDALTVEAPVGGQQLRFRYSAGGPDLASRGANTAASAYLALRQEMYARQQADRIAGYDRDLSETAQELAAVEERLAELPGSVTSAQHPTAAAALAELSGLRGELTQLREARGQVAAVDTTPGWVTRPAGESPPSSHDRALLLLLAGAAGGGLVGAVLALWVESGSRRVRTITEAVEVAGVPLAGMVRRRRPLSTAAATEADLRYAALALAARLREPMAGVDRYSEADPHRGPLVLVTPRPDPAVSELTGPLIAGVAVELAVAGRDVHVVTVPDRVSELRVRVLADQHRLAPVSAPATDGDGSGETPERRAAGGGAARGGGGRVALVDARPVAGVEPLADTIVVGSGMVRIGTDLAVVTAPAGPRDTPAAVLVDAPPAELSAEGVLAAQGGLAVVVVSCDRTRVAELRRLVDRLRETGARPIGVIVARA